MVFRYGAGESRFTETKIHVDEQQWSPVVFYDGPRCILCFRCVRACNEGMGVGALGVINRGADFADRAQSKAITWNATNAASASTSARSARSPAARIAIRRGRGKWSTSAPSARTARTAARPRSASRNDQIIRGNNRDRSGINGEFLCIKGRYAFDFYDHPERLQSPMIRVDGKLEPVSWSKALEHCGDEIQRDQGARRQVRRDRLEPHHQRRKLSICRSSRGRVWERIISITTAPATW